MSNEATKMVPAKNRQQTVKDLLEKAGPSMQSILPKHVTVERLTKVALSALARKPELLACTPQSLVRAVFQGAELGLEAGGLLGEAYLVPFKDEATLIVGYRGLVKLARQSGQITSIEARAVYAKDTLEVEYGMAPRLVHRPYLGNEDAGDIMFVYAVATFREGEKQVDVMSRSEIEKIRTRSKAGSDGPWKTDYAEMAKKTVVRRLCKMLPLSPEMARALEHSDAVDAGIQTTVDVDLFNELPEAEPPKLAEGSRTESLKAKLAHDGDGVVVANGAKA